MRCTVSSAQASRLTGLQITSCPRRFISPTPSAIVSKSMPVSRQTYSKSQRQTSIRCIGSKRSRNDRMKRVRSAIPLLDSVVRHPRKVEATVRDVQDRDARTPKRVRLDACPLLIFAKVAADERADLPTSTIRRRTRALCKVERVRVTLHA